jgi:hypothetical protein
LRLSSLDNRHGFDVKIDSGGKKRLLAGVFARFKLYYEAFCLGERHQKLEK